MEKRIANLTEEREHLSMSLEESSDRIMMLEKHNQDLEYKTNIQQKEVDELRHANSHLQNKLDSLHKKHPLSSSGSPMSQGHTSLYNEIEMSSSSSISQDDIDCDDILIETNLNGESEENWKVITV